MTADMTGGDSLASQCLAFCQTLASQGMDFHFSLTINSNFSFSLDTRKTKGNSAVAKKRSSPSTQRRNARRREAFLKRKLNPVLLSPSTSASDAPAEDQVKVGEVKTFKCEQCGNNFKSENGLKIHTGKAHKVSSTPPPPDRLRQQPGGSAASPLASPMLDASREECNLSTSEAVEEIVGLCKNCGAELRIIHDYWCCEDTKQLCNDCCYDLGVCNS